MVRATGIALAAMLMSASCAWALPFEAATQENHQPTADRFVTVYKDAGDKLLGTSTTTFDRYGGSTTTLRDASGRVVHSTSKGIQPKQAAAGSGSTPKASTTVVNPAPVSAQRTPSATATPPPARSPARSGVTPAPGRAATEGSQTGAARLPHSLNCKQSQPAVPPLCGLNGINVTGDSRKVGDTTYYSLRGSSGNNITGDSRAVGGTTYYNFRDQNGTSGSGNSRKVGDTTYYSRSDGRGRSSSGSSRTVGGTTYYSGTDRDGKRVSGSSRTIGGTTYYSGTDRDGKTVSGSSRSVGGTTYYSSHGH